MRYFYKYIIYQEKEQSEIAGPRQDFFWVVYSCRFEGKSNMAAK